MKVKYDKDDVQRLIEADALRFFDLQPNQRLYLSFDNYYWREATVEVVTEPATEPAAE
jgi:hypothetical protein